MTNILKIFFFLLIHLHVPRYHKDDLRGSFVGNCPRFTTAHLIDLFGGSEGTRHRLREGGEVDRAWAFTDASCRAMFKALDVDNDGRITLVRFACIFNFSI